MSAVSLRELTKAWAAAPPALDRVSLDVAPGEFVVLLGPSGCGKTTILRCIAGLEQPTSGDITIADRRVNDLPPKDRDVAMVFQNYALYPHLTVRENIGFPLAMRRVAKREIARAVAEAADVLGIGALLDRRPGQLSGGERQRTALGRALVRRPKLFLFDEPLSNLDARLRTEMRAELIALHRRLGATMLYVTHDQTEAMTMGDRIAILRAGRLLQVGTPQEIYSRPANAFVAQFVGSPGMNIVGERSPARADVRSLGFRPEDGRFDPVGGAELAGTVTLVEPLGSETLVHVRLDTGEPVVVRVRDGAPPALEERVGISVPPERRHAFGPEGDRLP